MSETIDVEWADINVTDMWAGANSQWGIRELTEEVLGEASDWCSLTFADYEERLKGQKNRLAP